MMTKGLLLFFALLAVVRGHGYLRRSITKLENKVRLLEAENDRIYSAMDYLESNLTAQIDAYSGGAGGRIISQVSGKGGQSVKMSADFEERLKALEERIHAIKNYLQVEKKLDVALRVKSDEVINVMEGKVTETDQVIDQLKTNVDNTLKDFETRIDEVNTIANVIINSDGTVMYGKIGSACTTYGQECTDDNSECRSGRCQCLPGLSYDIHERKCVKSCGGYGTTYQVVSRKIIRGYNDLTLNSTNLAECKKTCEAENAFQCRSFDYFPQWKQCYLSKNVVSDITDNSWEYNSEGIHFQRDCN